VGGDHQVVASSSPARGLYELAEDTAADLVILGSSRHGTAGQILAGSVGLALLHGSPCSVAIAPAGFADAAPQSIAEVTLGFDGSGEANAALQEAVDLARAAGAPLTIVSVAESPPIVYGKGAGATQVPVELMDAIREMAERHLDEACSQIPEDVAYERMLAEGHAAEALAEVAVADGGVLVVGSRAYGPLRRVLLGSVSTPLVRSAPCPLIVHPRPTKSRESAHDHGKTGATA
jgi:nucleotide-binding universal stress UspA family protein